jgi:hypothetical protein
MNSKPFVWKNEQDINIIEDISGIAMNILDYCKKKKGLLKMKFFLKTFICCIICLLFITSGTTHALAAGLPENDNLVPIGNEPMGNSYYAHYIDLSKSKFLNNDEALVSVYKAANNNLKLGILEEYQINFSNNTITQLSANAFINGKDCGRATKGFQQYPGSIPFYEQIKAYFANLRNDGTPAWSVAASNQMKAANDTATPTSTTDASVPVFDGTIQQYYNSHFSDKGRFFIEHSKEFGVRKVILSNLTCSKDEGAGIELAAIESEFPVIRNYMTIELLHFDGEPPYFVVGSESAIDDVDRLKVIAYETESMIGLKGTVTISFDRGTSTVTIDHILNDGNHEVLTKSFTHGPTMLCYSSNIEKTTMNGNIKVYRK